MSDDVLRIANASGFYGDRFDAPREMLEGGPIDVLTGDYLAELTMLILWRGKQKDPDTGYAKTFLRQMRDTLALAMDRGVKVVVNAGGLNPAGLAAALRELAGELEVDARIAHIEGDDLLDRLDDLQAAGHDLTHLDTGRTLSEAAMPPLTANAYLGGWGIAAALDAGADVVVCPRVTDASLVVGPAAWRFGWARDDWDALAGAVVAGHVIECGAQATGGNYAFFREVPGLTHPGFPIAEVAADGSSVITKHPGTGGLVSVGTVTAQLLYEIVGPRYANADVVARFDTIELSDDGPDRVRISGVRGEPAPADLKVCINTLGGFRNSMTFVLTGLDVEAKADLVERTLAERLDLNGLDDVDIRLVRHDVEDADRNEEATAHLEVTVKDMDANAIGRKAFASVAVELALSSYPGFTMTSLPGDASPFGVYWPALIDKGEVTEVVVDPDGERHEIAQTRTADERSVTPPVREIPDAPAGETRRVPLGTIIGARSGDKGGNANIGFWARSDAGYAWLAAFLTEERIRQLLPEAATLPIERHALPNLRAVNVVIGGLLGEGVSSSTRPDPQAKGLGEFFRARYVDIPVALLADDERRTTAQGNTPA